MSSGTYALTNLPFFQLGTITYPFPGGPFGQDALGGLEGLSWSKFILIAGAGAALSYYLCRKFKK